MKALSVLNILLISVQLSSQFFLSRRRRAPQPVPRDCSLSVWETDGACSKTCGPGGVEKQTRQILVKARNGGTECSSYEQEKIVPCNRVCHHEGTLQEDKCDCRSGWTGECCDEDVNECDATPSPCSQICANKDGSHSCECFENYTLDDDNINCSDVEECQGEPPPCTQRCRELEGGYECYCYDGYKLDSDGTTCNDIDECKTGSLCQHASCKNTDGDYECECQNGYERNADKKTCTDIDECVSLNEVCDQECENTDGGYGCNCGQGYILADDSIRCNDVDECELHGTTLCTQLCVNIPGSYKCACVLPYTLNTDLSTCSCVADEDACSEARKEAEATRKVGSNKDALYNGIIGALIIVCLILFLVLVIMCYRRGYYKLLVPKPPPISTIPRHNNAVFNSNIADDDASGIYEDPECHYEELQYPPDYMEMAEPDSKNIENDERVEENHYVENDYQDAPGPSTSARDPAYVDGDTPRDTPRDPPRDTPRDLATVEYSTKVPAEGFDHEEGNYENNPPFCDNI